MARSRSSARWMQRHLSDSYVKRARAEGYRSRAAFKLLEIDARDRLLRRGAVVVDLGAAPGGWSQVAARKAGPDGKVIAIDLLELAPIEGVSVLRGNFLDPALRLQIDAVLGGAKADLVLSDLSPNISGIAASDQARAAELLHAAIEFCGERLKPGGALLAKAFQGEDFALVMREMKAAFREVQVRKPAASRGESRETYLLGRDLKSS